MTDEQDQGERTITDADARAIAIALRTTLADEVYRDLGRGLWSMAKKGLFAIILLLVAYGAFKGMPLPRPQ